MEANIDAIMRRIIVTIALAETTKKGLAPKMPFTVKDVQFVGGTKVIHLGPTPTYPLITIQT